MLLELVRLERRRSSSEPAVRFIQFARLLWGDSFSAGIQEVKVLQDFGAPLG
jgi:hypothetical protein